MKKLYEVTYNQILTFTGLVYADNEAQAERIGKQRMESMDKPFRIAAEGYTVKEEKRSWIGNSRLVLNPEDKNESTDG